MTGKIILIVLLLSSFVLLGTTRQNSVNPQTSVSRPASMTATQVESLKDDLNKMRSLVQQMEANLSLVDTTQSPLKHQFQLEIDMWRLTIQRMDKQLQGTR